jgi:ankyrin repeat protein
MSRRGQLSTSLLIAAGGHIEAFDAYGYTPLHRMASNNLAIGAEALIKAGANANKVSGKPYAGETPMSIARQSRAMDVIQVLNKYGVK